MSHRTKNLVLALGGAALLSTLLCLLVRPSALPSVGQLCHTDQSPQIDAHGTMLVCRGDVVWTPTVRTTKTLG